MRLLLARKEDLTQEQLQRLDSRLQHSVKLEGECGPIRAWYAYTRYLYAFVNVNDQAPIAIAEASGRPASGPGWWLDPAFRGQGYGAEIIDLLAEHLRADGVTAILPIPIQTPGGNYDEQSRRLVVRLRSHFPVD